jgi:sigma-B regulation protein RsbU (phosphoserine phosphatase)
MIVSPKIRNLLPGILAIFSALVTLACIAPRALALQPESHLAAPATFDLATDRQPILSLDGLWRFHPGDDPAWADPTLDDASWPLLRSDQPWSDQGYPGLGGIAWYRFTIQLPAGSRSFSLMLAPIVTSYEIYVDGRLAGTCGAMPPTIQPNFLMQFHVFPLPQTSPGPASATPRTVHIALRVWQSKIWAGFVGGGTYQPGNLAGETSLIEAELGHRLIARKIIFVDDYVYSIAAALVGFTILGLFYFRPKEREYLWFAILLLSQASDAALQIAHEISSFLSVPVFDLSSGVLGAINRIAALAFFSIVLRARRGAVWHIILVLTLLSPFPELGYWPGWLSAAAGNSIDLAFMVPVWIWILVLVLRRAINRDVDARLLSIPTVLMYGFSLVYSTLLVLVQDGRMEMPDILDEPLPLPPFTMHWSVLFSLIFLAGLLAFLIRRFTMARQGEERYTGQLEAARQVQTLLLPEAIPQIDGFAIDCVYRPAEMVGGDFFQILPVTGFSGERNLLIVVGDVAGKGLPAAMLVSMIVGAIQAEATHTADPGQIVAALNDRLTGRNAIELGSGFTTCLCAHISTGGRLVLANAGHLPPYRNGRELPMPGALPLGMLTGVTYDLVTTQLQPGDRLTFVSDGIVEAQGRSGELLGFDRAEALSTKSATEIAEIANRFGQVDDITVVTIEFLGTPAAASSGLPPKSALV